MCRASPFGFEKFGPLVVEGPVQLLDSDGTKFTVVTDKPKIALCRYGISHKKPFCNGFHKACGIATTERAVSGAAGLDFFNSNPATRVARNTFPGKEKPQFHSVTSHWSTARLFPDSLFTATRPGSLQEP